VRYKSADDLSPQERRVMMAHDKIMSSCLKKEKSNPYFKLNKDALGDKFPLFEYCVQSLKKQIGKSSQHFKDVSFHWSVSDWQSSDGDPKEIFKKSWDDKKCHSKVTVIERDGFSRGHGLNVALQAIDPEPNDIVFFVDVDMLFLGVDMILDYMNSPKDSASFPVCYRALSPSNLMLFAEWAGYGNVLLRGEHLKNVNWIEYDKWGGEDTNYYEKIAKNLKILRKNYPTFIHQWHSGKIK
jgi:hypothetical protein